MDGPYKRRMRLDARVRAGVLLLSGLLSCASPGAGPTASPVTARSTPAPAAPAPAPAAASAEAAKLVPIAWARLRAKDASGALELFARAWEGGARDEQLVFGAACAAASTGSVSKTFEWLDREFDAGLERVSWTQQASCFAAVLADPRFASWAARMRDASEARAVRLHVGEGLAPSAAAAEGIDPVALQTLVAESERARSSALVVVHDGKLVGRWYFGGGPHRIEAMSASKSIVALAVAAALDDGRIPSLDTPVSTWFPEWKQGRKQKITLRMLLNHTSGLQADRTTEEIYASPDFVQLALAAELEDEPGKRFFYNNKAVNLLPEIVARATGRPFDTYVRERLLARLGIEDVRFMTDGAGHVHGMAGFQVQPLDLAKIGQMFLDGGTWKGKPVLARSWIEELSRPGQSLDPGCGLLWWIHYGTDETVLEPASVKAASKHGLPAAIAAKLQPLEGKSMPTREFRRKLRALLAGAERTTLSKALADAGVDQKRTIRDPFAFAAEGSFGQYLLVLPKARLVAVRMIDAGQAKGGSSTDFDDFATLVRALVRN